MRNKTIIFFNCYFIFTILYYCFGKWEWNIPSYPKLLIYLSICYLFLNIGYNKILANKNFITQKKIYNNIEDDEINHVEYKKIRKIFLISSILLIIFQIAWVYVFLGKFSISSVFTTLGSNYYERLEATFDSKIPIMQIRTILWGLTFFCYPIGFLYFKKMPIIDKIIFITTILVDSLAALNMGISKNIGDIIIIAIGMTFLKNSKINKKDGKSKNKTKTTIVILLLIFIVIFGKIQDLRDDYTHKIVNPYGRFASINYNTPYYIIFGENSGLSKIIDKIGGYTANSYTGLAYAMEIPFKNTYLIGASRALMEYAEQYLNISIKDKTYNYRIDFIYGWKDGQWWPTAFVWIANSVSFWGVPIILYFLGRFIRRLEEEYKKEENILTAVMYGQMLIMLFYLPCNMQLLQARSALFGFVFLLITYLFRNKRIKLKKI